MDIKVEDYLTEQEMKNIATEAFRSKISQLLREDSQVERVIYNSCYYVVRGLVDAHFDGDVESHIKAKVIASLDQLAVSDVFGHSFESYYTGTKPPARILLEKTVEDNKDLLSERVGEVIQSMDQYDMRWKLEESVVQCLMERMFGKVEPK